MQYDRTRLTIRQRDLWEILDLTLVLMRQQFKPLVASCLLLWLPMSLANWLLLYPLIRDELTTEQLARHVMAMTCLAIIQSPLATLGGTLYLGRYVFFEELTVRQVFADLRELAPRWLWGMGVCRWILPAWAVAALIDPAQSFSDAEGWLLVLTAVAMFQRAMYPHLPEVLVLERCAYRVQDTRQLSVGRRMRLLRASSGGEGWSRIIALSLPVAWVAFMLALSAWFMARTILGTYRFDIVLMAFCWTLALGFCSVTWMVVNFLSYLDLRIRREGWDVRLWLQAASAAEGAA